MKRFLSIFFVFALAACSSYADPTLIGTGMSKTAPDPLPSRFISMVYPASDEKLDVVYFHNGGYDPKVMHAIDHLFRDHREGVVAPIDPELIDFLVDIRTRLGLPPSVTFEILDGYRTPESNAFFSKHNGNVAIESLHVRGWAVDFRIPGVDGRAICEIAKTMQRGGVAFYPTSNHVHVDLGNIRTWHEK